MIKYFELKIMYNVKYRSASIAVEKTQNGVLPI